MTETSTQNEGADAAAAPAPGAAGRRADDLLKEVLRGDEPADVRCEAALALAALGRRSAEVVESLTHALDDGDDDVRRAATLALGKTGDGRAAEPLLAALEHSPELWEAASAALSELGFAPATERLRELVRSASDSRTRRGAIRALALLSSSGGRLERAAFSQDTSISYPLL
jgi:HEAT repeat protein